MMYRNIRLAYCDICDAQLACELRSHKTNDDATYTYQGKAKAYRVGKELLRQSFPKLFQGLSDEQVSVAAFIDDAGNYGGISTVEVMNILEKMRNKCKENAEAMLPKEKVYGYFLTGEALGYGDVKYLLQKEDVYK